MIPIRTRRSNFVYRGPTPDIGDAWTERVPGERAVYLTWQLSPAERADIAAGRNIRLGIYGMEPIPPVSLNIDDLGEISAAAAAWRDRALAILRKLSPSGPGRVPAGFWSTSYDVWTSLQADGALDGGGGIPTLLGRPLITSAEAAADTLEYAVAAQTSTEAPA